ncbi:hypothetical protein GCM10020218_103260 [Dactylosporangium vinaceum]
MGEPVADDVAQCQIGKYILFLLRRQVPKYDYPIAEYEHLRDTVWKARGPGAIRG